MKNTLSLLLLLLTFSSVKCQNMESLQTAVQIKAGETLSLSCRGSGLAFSSHYKHWIRKQAGKPLEWMGYISSRGDSKGYAASFQGRTEISRDNPNSMVYLKLSGVTAEDSAVYYCVRDYGGAFDYWGKGTMVTVSSGVQTAPTSIFQVSACSSSDGFLTLGCVASGFSPADSLTFKWTGDVSDMVQYPAVQADGSYTAVSHVRVKESDWIGEKAFMCKAESPAGSREGEIKKVKSKPENKTNKETKKPASKGQQPSILFYKPEKHVTDTDRVSLLCEVSSSDLGDVPIIWKINKGQYMEGSSTTRINNNTILSYLTISGKDYNSAEFTCAVKDASMENGLAPKQESTSKKKIPAPDPGLCIIYSGDSPEEDDFSSLWSTASSFIFLFLFTLVYSTVLSLSKMK